MRGRIGLVAKYPPTGIHCTDHAAPNVMANIIFRIEILTCSRQFDSNLFVPFKEIFVQIKNSISSSTVLHINVPAPIQNNAFIMRHHSQVINSRAAVDRIAWQINI